MPPRAMSLLEQLTDAGQATFTARQARGWLYPGQEGPRVLDATFAVLQRLVRTGMLEKLDHGLAQVRFTVGSSMTGGGTPAPVGGVY
jgi:hypothetical protein